MLLGARFTSRLVKLERRSPAIAVDTVATEDQVIPPLPISLPG